MLVYFQSLVNLIGRVVYRYSNRLGCLMPCESLDGFQETRTHSKIHGGCHVSTLSGLGRDIFTKYGVLYPSSSVSYIGTCACKELIYLCLLLLYLNNFKM